MEYNSQNPPKEERSAYSQMSAIPVVPTGHSRWLGKTGIKGSIGQTIAAIDGWDKRVIRAWNLKMQASQRAQRGVNYVSFFGSAFVWLWGGIVLTVLAFSTHDYRQLSYFEGSLLQSWGIFLVIKYTVQRRRPFLQDPVVHKMDRQTRKLGFPSGHAYFFMVFWMFFFYNSEVFWGFLFLIITGTLAVGVTRILLGVHYPSDVIMGIVLGFLTSTVSYVWTQEYFRLFFYWLFD